MDVYSLEFGVCIILYLRSLQVYEYVYIIITAERLCTFMFTLMVCETKQKNKTKRWDTLAAGVVPCGRTPRKWEEKYFVRKFTAINFDCRKDAEVVLAIMCGVCTRSLYIIYV